MKTYSKLIRKLLTFGLFMAIAFCGLLASAMANDPKIHVLFVWATNATDTQACTERSREIFEDAMERIDICEGGEDIASFTSLSGMDAHPENILRQCRRMAQQAGPNDALFVYILSHGASVDSDKSTDHSPINRIHGLSPIATDAKHMNLRQIGIARASILKAMKSTSHRLDVLITDACSTYNANPVAPPTQTAIPKTLSGATFFRLNDLLLNARGTINWNSTNPIGGYSRQGESAIGTRKKGTIFTQAFISVACAEAKKNEYTIQDFFNELGSALVDEYKDAKIKARGSASYDETFGRQSQQTLTVFNERGRYQSSWKEEENRVNYKY